MDYSRKRHKQRPWAAALAVTLLAAGPALSQTTATHEKTQNAPFGQTNPCNGDEVTGEGTLVTNTKTTTKDGAPTHIVTKSNHNGQGIGTSGLKYSFGEQALDNVKTTAPFLISRHRLRLVNETNADNFFVTDALTIHRDGRIETKFEPSGCRG